MAYTLWHCGKLIGETDFEDEDKASGSNGSPRRHLAGSFRPTAYGRTVLPRLCGMLTAASELKAELLRRGMNADDVPPEMIDHLFHTTAAGAHIVDIGRVLCDVALHSPSGKTLEVTSMSFLELAELASLSRKLGSGEMREPREMPPDAPEFLVSVTLRERRHYRARR